MLLTLPGTHDPSYSPLRPLLLTKSFTRCQEADSGSCLTGPLRLHSASHFMLISRDSCRFTSSARGARIRSILCFSGLLPVSVVFNIAGITPTNPCSSPCARGRIRLRSSSPAAIPGSTPCCSPTVVRAISSWCATWPIWCRPMPGRRKARRFRRARIRGQAPQGAGRHHHGARLLRRHSRAGVGRRR